MKLLPSLLTTLLAVTGYTDIANALSVGRNPLRKTTQIEDVHFTTDWQLVHAWSTFATTFKLVDGSKERRIRLELSPNEDVISKDAYVQVIGPDGQPKYGRTIDRAEHRVFKGSAFVRASEHDQWRNAGWARVMVVADGRTPLFEGAFSIDGDNHHVETATNFARTRHDEDPTPQRTDKAGKGEYMVAWRDSDIRGQGDEGDWSELRRRDGSLVPRKASGCGVDDNHVRVDAEGGNEDGPMRHKIRDVSPNLASSPLDRLMARQNRNDVANIGSTRGCPTTRRVALIGIATDCNYRGAFSSDQDVRANIVNLVNTASALYERTFNITFAIRNLTISARECPTQTNDDNAWNTACSPSTSISTRLSQFSNWRGRLNDNAAFWTLFSTCTTNTAVGISWLGAACMKGSTRDRTGTSVAGANYVARTNGGQSEWQVFAHEVGHTFGADHDCNSDLCATSDGTCCPLSSTTCDARSQFIMNPSANRGIDNFSQCTIGSVCSQLGAGTVSMRCLVDNRDVETAVDPVCGNGIVEASEQCDSKNPCCDSATCRYRAGATCDPSSDGCCTAQCGVAPAERVCRPSTGTCDPEEKCDGKAAQCPPNVDNTNPNGRGCTSNGGGIVGDIGATASNWFEQNKPLAIGLIAGIGGLIALLTVCCCISSCRRKRAVRRQRQQMIAARNAQAASQPGFANGAPGSGPLPPPPSYWASSSPPMAQQPGWRPQRTMSARYA
ncbi:hypothetical protein RB594_003427 [Gaeumannomyces avenae]